MSEANKTQVGGTHYQSDFQHWDLIAETFGASYYKGVITKYIFRWRKKNGIEDLRKAHHYAVKLVELLNQDKIALPLPWGDASEFCMANDMENVDAELFCQTIAARDLAAMVDVRNGIQTLINLQIKEPA